MKKNNFLKILFFHFCFLVLAIFLLVVANHREYQKFTVSINSYLGGIIDSLEKHYPDLSKEEIIELLNAQNTKSETLEKLGINQNSIAILTLQKNQKNNLWIGILSILFVDGLGLLFFFWYHHRQKKKIEEITDYLKEINKKNYKLNLEDEKEDDLSLLKSELYKIVVMLKEESENAEKEKKSLKILVEDISHQLKTPITSIRILLDNLETIEMPEETKKEFLHDISTQIEKMKALTISLLTFARFNAGVVELERKPFLLADFFKELEKNVGVLLDLHGLTLEVIGDKKIKMVGDYRWELEAVTNIVKNAIEHSKRGGTVKISYEETPFYTTIRIQDEGLGISKKDQKHIFERFYKSETANSESFGIGLSLSKIIIEKDNGTISCESQEMVGTTFEIKYLKSNEEVTL